MSKQKGEDAIGELGLSRNYFSKSMLPEPPTLRRQSVCAKQSYAQYDGIELLFVEEGSGTMEVNGQSSPICRGSCFILFFYHFRRITPDPGTTVKLVSIRITYSSYLFLSTAPSWDLSAFEKALYLPQATFQDAVRTRCETIIMDIERLLASVEFNREQQLQVLLAELIARLYREALSKGGDGACAD